VLLLADIRCHLMKLTFVKVQRRERGLSSTMGSFIYPHSCLPICSQTQGATIRASLEILQVISRVQPQSPFRDADLSTAAPSTPHHGAYRRILCLAREDSCWTWPRPILVLITISSPHHSYHACAPSSSTTRCALYGCT
jgi:hypothetical protein